MAGEIAERIKRPNTPPDIVIPKNGNACQVEVWFDLNLFYIHNGWVDEDEVLNRVRVDSKAFYNAAEYLEKLIELNIYPTDTKASIIHFLVSRTLLD